MGVLFLEKISRKPARGRPSPIQTDPTDSTQSNPAIHLVQRDSKLFQRDRLKIRYIDPTLSKGLFSMWRHKLMYEVRSNGEFLSREIKERWHWLSVWQSSTLNTKFVKEFMTESLDGGESSGRGVLEQIGDKCDGVRWSSRSENLGEWVRFDLRELVFHVVWVHGLDLFPSRCTQNLDDLHKLINA